MIIGIVYAGNEKRGMMMHKDRPNPVKTQD
jgi:hypothetical protein